MERRRFLTLAAAAAAGAVGVVGRGGNSGASTPDGSIPLVDAAGPPEGARLGTRRVVWSVDTTEPVVAFTFDDGPDPEITPRILEILDHYRVPATFFVMGYNAAQRPDLLVDVARRGHDIGNHTWTHVELTDSSPEEARRELSTCSGLIESTLGTPPRFLRPPRGQLSGATVRYAAEVGNDIVFWSVGRGVAGEGTAPEIADYVLSELTPGDIVLLHDGIGREGLRDDLDGPGPVRRRREVEIRALPEILERTLEQGLRPVRISDLLAVEREGTGTAEAIP